MEASAAAGGNVDVLKSPSDKKQYRYLKLENGMAVLLIHDPEISGAAAHAASGKGDTEMADGDCSGSGSGYDDEDEEDEDEDEDEDGSSDEEATSMSEGTRPAGSDASIESGSDDDDDDDGDDDDDEGGGRGKKGKKGAQQAPAASKKAAAAMAVGVGSFSDPRDLPGLSHYLEHMLFMGSEKFPDENDYDAFLVKHGGSSNAYTELEYTNYHFEVAPAHLRGALERFAQFFVAPLCKQSAMEREVCAVDSEFSGVLQDDHSRLCQLMCHTSKAGHVYNKFSWGNKKSLWEQPAAQGLDVRGRLLDYYRREYGAERMCLAVLGGEPLDELEGWARDLFSPVRGGHCGPAPTFEGEGFPFEGGVLHIAPAVKEHHEVTVTFQLPSLRRHYTTKPDHYVCHLVGHEGPGSLLSALKSRGWVTDLCAGVEDDGYGANSCCYLFSVAMTLTEAGLSAGPGLGLAPVALLFQYMRLLQQAGPQEWVWRELKAISDMKFRFLEDEDACDYVTRLAATLGVVTPRHVLAADWLHEAWEPERVTQLLDSFSPSGGSYRIDLLTTGFKDIKGRLMGGDQNGGGAAWQLPDVFTEPWFGMEAAAVRLPEELTRSWAEADVAPDLALPPPNPYIPTDFTVWGEQAAAAASAPSPELSPFGAGGAGGAGGPPGAEGSQGSVESWLGGAMGLPVVLASPPTLSLDEPGLRLWHKLDTRFKQPRAHFYCRLASPAGYTSPRAAALMGLWLKLVEDALNEDAYMADVAGLHYSASPEGYSGVELRVDGFSQKLPVLAEKLLSCAARCEVRASSFGRVHESFSRKYRNANMSVGKAANYSRLYALQCHMWHVDAVSAALAGITGVEEVQAFASEFMSSCHLELFILGNVPSPAAAALARRLHAAAGPGARLPAAARPCDVCARLPVGRALLHSQPAKNPEEKNCCVEVYFQVGPASDLKLRASLDLVDQVLYEPCYDTLRTKQQLGYTVHSGSRLTFGVLGFCVVVVSADHTADAVEGCVEAFLADFREQLQCLSPEEFDRHRTALVSNKLTRDAALGQEGDRAWDAIWSGRNDFLAREQEAQVLGGATLQEVQQLFDDYLWPLSPKRRKLAVRVIPYNGPAAGGPAAAAAGADGAEAAAAAAASPRKGGGRHSQQRKAQEQQQEDHHQQQQQQQQAAERRKGAQHHVQHAHPHHGSGHLLPPLGGSPRKAAAAAAASRAGTHSQSRHGGKGHQQGHDERHPVQGAGGGPAAAAGKLPPKLPVPEVAVADLDELKRSLETYPATLSMMPVIGLQQ